MWNLPLTRYILKGNFRGSILLPRSQQCVLQYVIISSRMAFTVCGHLGLWQFISVAVPVCGRFGLWLFQKMLIRQRICIITATMFWHWVRCGVESSCLPVFHVSIDVFIYTVQVFPILFFTQLALLVLSTQFILCATVLHRHWPSLDFRSCDLDNLLVCSSLTNIWDSKILPQSQNERFEMSLHSCNLCIGRFRMRDLLRNYAIMLGNMYLACYTLAKMGRITCRVVIN